MGHSPDFLTDDRWLSPILQNNLLAGLTRGLPLYICTSTVGIVPLANNEEKVLFMKVFEITYDHPKPCQARQDASRPGGRIVWLDRRRLANAVTTSTGQAYKCSFRLANVILIGLIIS